MKLTLECKNKNQYCGDEICIKNIAFLNGMPEQNQAELIKNATHKTLNKGDYIFREGEAVDSITIINHGHVKLNTYDAEGREKIIGIFADSDTIWEGIFAADSTYPYSAVCLTKTHICRIFRKDVEAAVSNPTVAMSVLDMLSSKLHDANERNMILSITDPMAKIAAFLLYRAKRSAEPVITLRLDDIAASVGLRPETVSRYIRKMINLGYIDKVGQSGIRIIGFESLNMLINE